MVNTYRIARALAAMPPPRRQIRASAVVRCAASPFRVLRRA